MDELGRDDLPESKQGVRLCDLLPIFVHAVALKGEELLELARVIEPQAVEVARGEPRGAEVALGVAADDRKAVHKRVVARVAPHLPRADVVDVVPEAVDLPLALAEEDICKQPRRVARAHPFEGGIEHDVEHEGIAHVVFEHLIVQHGTLAQNDELFKPRIEDVALRLELVQFVGLERAGKERIAHPAEGVRHRAVAVDCHRGDVDERGLGRAGAHGLRHRRRAAEVDAVRERRRVIGHGRDDPRHVQNILGARNKAVAVLPPRHVAADDLDARPVLPFETTGKFVVLFLRSEQHAHARAHRKGEHRFERFPAHIAAHARHGDLHL